MKTGRRRKKDKSEQEETGKSPQATVAHPRTKSAKPAAARSPAQPTRRSKFPVLPILVALSALLVGAMVCGRSCLGARTTPTTYVAADADGSWTTTVKIVAPQVAVRGRYRSDCDADANCTVIPGTCEVRERADAGAEQTVDDYDEYAYSIYYEEAEDRLYEAAGQDFVPTELNAARDWWDGDRHYYSEEWLDRETCQYTQYTVWITDPDDPEYEVEVVLSECEVWDHVVVKERAYREEAYCQTENVESLAVQDVRTLRGAGTLVEWPDTVAPAGGELVREFEGTVEFRAEGARRTVETTDVDKYMRYLTVPHYLGLDEDGDVVNLTDRAP